MYRLSFVSGRWIAYDMGDEMSEQDLQDIKILAQDGIPTLVVADLDDLEDLDIVYEGPSNA